MVVFGWYFNMFGIVYKITNLINGKIYIGQTKRDFEVRWKEHCRIDEGLIVDCAINKYGKQNFDHWVMVRCDSLEEMNHREEYYIRLFNSTNKNIGYNISKGGNNREVSEETRNKLSASKMGENNPMFGKIPSEETRKKISIANSGENNYMFGKSPSEETRAKMSASKMGETHPLFGKTRSEETRKKISNAKNSVKIAIFCPELNKNFESINQAARFINCNPSSVFAVLYQKKQNIKGLTFIRTGKPNVI